MESFEQLKNQYTPMIYKIISTLNITINKDEFFQHGLIALWEAHQRFDAYKGAFTSYAYSFIRGRILTELDLSRQYNERWHQAKVDLGDYIADPFSTSPLEEDTLLCYCQSGCLTENQTKWVLYTFLNQLDVKEIAEIEHVSLSAVKNWRAGAKEKLRRIMEENVL
ncbi:sigma-70 family RNA polymerase sigma factor [Mesobacillus foraminis]|uniref:sigma-70 family RNA polymerase sigma factor n=1 Tax=Mesobacillus foraminis TaxID=279826 RepID=UPI001BECD7DB|nr:sigma-70 family RNA polymerase sigma factor [Mesobacillus foraminis]MBT2756718.1 sigma-70 family RNA polymerase sigma factor [Mesobacillus foraminis]